MAAVALVACGARSEAELVASAKTLMTQNDPKGAVIQLKNALQQSPDSAAVRLLLGRALLATGDTVSAVVELRKARELQAADDDVVPPLAQAMLAAGEEGKLITQYGDMQLKDPTAAAELATALAGAYGVIRELPKAQASAEAALQAKPGHVPALVMLARLRAAAGEIDPAIALLDQALAADASNEAAGVLKADLLVRRKNDPAGGLAALQQVLAGHPESVAARAAAANVLYQQKQVPQAKAEFEQLRKTAANHPETLYLEALFAFDDGNDKRAREITEQILKAFPDNVRVLELAGAAEFRQKGYLQAEALLSRALKLAPQQRLARLTLAQTYLRTGEPAKTLDLLKPVIDSGAADAAALSLAGQAHLQLGDETRSAAAFDQALKLAPTDPRVRTTAAMARLARGGDNAGAISELEAVASGDSGTRADLALVSARMRQGDHDGAMRAIDALEKKIPQQALPHQLRGRLLAAKKDTSGAARSYAAALAVEPAYFPAVASLAAIDLSAGKPADARARFQSHLKQQPQSWQAQLALAELDARTGAAPASVTAGVREAVKINPAEVRPHLVLVSSLLAGNDPKGALLAAQEASSALPNNLEVLEALGRAELAAGDHQRAISTLRKLTGLQPRNPMPELRLAEAHAAAGDRSAAERSLRRALELQPDLPQARRGLAQLAVIDRRPADALTIARDLQKARPKDAAGFVLEGEIEAASRRWDPAIAAFRAALQRQPLTNTAVQLHRTLLAAAKGPEAERAAADWLQSHPKDTAFRYHLGDVALAAGQWAAAEARYREVLAIDAENALALNNVAWLLARQGKPGALAAAERANALLPGRAALLDTLSTALEAENRLPQAIEAQKRALERDPQSTAMTLRLAKLYIKSGDKARARSELETLDKLGARSGAQAEVAQLLKTL